MPHTENPTVNPTENRTHFADHFTLFGLPRRFRVDPEALDGAYRALQAQVHPDRFTQAGEFERRVSLQWATQINEAYQCLKNPLSRARYLLNLLRPAPEECASAVSPSPEFLMEQMEWREAVARARAERALDTLEALHASIRQKMDAHYADLAASFDEKHDDASAFEGIQRMMFLEKLLAEIDDGIAALEELP